MADRTIRSAEAGNRLHLNSIKALCDACNRKVLIALSPNQFFDSTVSGPVSISNTSSILMSLIEKVSGKGNGCRIEDIVAPHVVYCCELGTLIGISEVKHSIAAFRNSCYYYEVEIQAQFSSNDYAAASWAMIPRNLSVAGQVAERFGFTSVRINQGLIVEAWDYPACNSHIGDFPSVPPHWMSNRSLEVNGELIRTQRTAAALTQDELAHRTGLSVRLIRSAEKGMSISMRSCHILAQPLSLPVSTLKSPREDGGLRPIGNERADRKIHRVFW